MKDGDSFLVNFDASPPTGRIRQTFDNKTGALKVEWVDDSYRVLECELKTE